MTNYGKYDLPIFIDDIETIKEVTKIVFNTILFHRYLGEKKYKDIESIISNIYYIQLDDANLQRDINFNIDLIEKNIVKKGSVQVVLQFYQQKVKQYFLLEKLDNLWESWNFYFMLDNKYGIKDKDNKQLTKEEKVREYIFQVINLLNDKYDFMPDMNEQKEIFPYEIHINSDINETDLLSILKNVGGLKQN